VSLPSDECEKSEPLRNVVKEAMRLHPVAAGGSMRVTGIDMETNEGFLLPKGSFVFLPLILLLRNPRVYNNPDQFLPERWQEADQAMTDSFLPFSLGKQNCVGQALAKIELHSVVARICSEFDLSVVQECETEFFLTLKPIGAKLLARRAIPLS
jgi:cytochrome P450